MKSFYSGALWSPRVGYDYKMPGPTPTRSSHGDLVFICCFCHVRYVFDLSGHCNDMQAFLVICPLSKQARQEIDDLKQMLAAREESHAKAVTLCHVAALLVFNCFLSTNLVVAERIVNVSHSRLQRVTK